MDRLHQVGRSTILERRRPIRGAHQRRRHVLPKILGARAGDFAQPLQTVGDAHAQAVNFDKDCQALFEQSPGRPEISFRQRDFGQIVQRPGDTALILAFSASSRCGFQQMKERQP